MRGLCLAHRLRLFASLLDNCSKTPRAWWETQHPSGLVGGSKCPWQGPPFPCRGCGGTPCPVCAGGQTVLARFSPCAWHGSCTGSRVVLGWGMSSAHGHASVSQQGRAPTQRFLGAGEKGALRACSSHPLLVSRLRDIWKLRSGWVFSGRSGDLGSSHQETVTVL